MSRSETITELSILYVILLKLSRKKQGVAPFFLHKGDSEPAFPSQRTLAEIADPFLHNIHDDRKILCSYSALSCLS